MLQLPAQGCCLSILLSFCLCAAVLTENVCTGRLAVA
jgi:hypothetical protein